MPRRWSSSCWKIRATKSVNSRSTSLARCGLVAHPDAAVAGDLAADPGNAQTAFPTLDHLLGSLDDLRVDHHLGLHCRRIGITRAGPRGHQEQGRRLINLRRREAHALGLA